jgi:hypothetical protein
VGAAAVTDEDKVGEFDWRIVPVDEIVEKEKEILGMEWMTMFLEGIIGEAVIRHRDWTICGAGDAAG